MDVLVIAVLCNMVVSEDGNSGKILSLVNLEETEERVATDLTWGAMEKVKCLM